MRRHDYAPRPAHISWLLDSDPAIRWQVMRDLTGEARDAIAAERSRVATEGWGAQLLARQSPAGHWGEGPKWDLITLYSLVVLMDLGLDPASKQACKMIDPVHQRQNPRHWRVFQGTERRTGQAAPGRAARRWRLELRSVAVLTAETPSQPALFVSYHHLRARGTARIRTGRAQIGSRH